MRKCIAILILLVVLVSCFQSMIKLSNGMKIVQANTNEEKVEEYKGMVIIESKTGRILNSYNNEKRLPMASTTKILTAILTIENAIDLDTRYPLPEESIGVEGSSMFLRKEEHFSLRELLYGLMLSSGNDSATALAILVFGSEKDYVLRANAFLQQLGLADTKVSNAHGLHDEEHYTTANDLARLAVYAMRNQTFRDIVSTRQYDIKKSPTNEQRIMKNKNKILRDYDYSNGVKTGFTPEAGRCLVVSAMKNNMELVCVLLNSPKMEEVGEELLEQAFAKYTMTEIIPAHNHISTISTKNSKVTEVNIYSKESFLYPITDSEKVQVKIEYDYPIELIAPVESGQIVGKIRVKLSNQLLFETNIYTIEKADSNELLYIIRKVIKNFV